MSQKYLLFLKTSEKTRYTQTNNSEKLYFDLSKSKNPIAARGKINMKVITLTALSADFSENRLHSIRNKICPPSSDITGIRLNNPTDKFAAANGKNKSSQNKYNR